MRRRLAALAVLPLLLGGCGSSRVDPSGPVSYVDGGTFRVGTASDVASFNPYSSFGSYWSGYSYDSLVHQAADGSVVSGLAQHWQVTATRATFTLRRGITCEDGHALSATDVAAALRFVGNPANLTKVPGALYLLPPGDPYTVAADDAGRRVTVRMARPFSFIERTVGAVPIVCPGGLADPGALDHRSDGTGPYRLVDYTSGGPYTFRVRPGYRWGPGGADTAARGTPRTIVVTVSPNTTTSANQLLTGELDGATIDGIEGRRLLAAGLYRYGAPSVHLAHFNEKTGRVLADGALRRALVAGLDRGDLAKVATAGTGRPAAALHTVGSACHATTSDQLPRADPAAARAQLDRDGWRAGSDGVRRKDGRTLAVKLVTGTSYGATLPATAEYLAAQWKELGARVTVQILTGAQLAAADATGDWDAMIISSDVAQPPSQLVAAYSGPGLPAGQNYGAIHNRRFESQAGRAITRSGAASCPIWTAAERELMRAADVLPIADDTVAYFGAGARYRVSPTTLVPDPTTVRLVR